MGATTLPWTRGPCSGEIITDTVIIIILGINYSTFRKTGENTFEPVSDQELARLSNVQMPESIEVVDSDNDNDSADSDSDDGWETTEELGDDGDVNDQENDV